MWSTPSSLVLADWARCRDLRSDRDFFFNHATKTVVWELPSSETRVGALLGFAVDVNEDERDDEEHTKSFESIGGNDNSDDENPWEGLG